ncbi:hypothetical protein TCAL_01650 [Tigriopus californicus]|uniref:RING-type E3 ubiquitin transferase n=1 Tax=Tigriopus californicus TaxID=6832 RepID=A0A553PC94_TIGCA|nr:E3 ubiquitin-protein ligase rnf168-like [Tigriopus californicus]TRY75306.1 hypothetical protein TCAL_01650 [Tigriopus californicus]|eukprot:TCALIF_01650-PA protein Name:"Similar to rnf168 E3 ubiquitin-protein ligase RNF168 (Danio rerio)" AED:0.00 eAED:0.00 QI:33/1/1/1/1/1/2/151/356
MGLSPWLASLAGDQNNQGPEISISQSSSNHELCASMAGKSFGLNKSLDVSDVLCHICLSILIEPVTMPCQHRMCKVCFHRNLEVNSLLCPMCKKRIGTWARRRKDHELVDQELWRQIQDQFPQRVETKLAGIEEDAEDLEDLFPCVPTHQYTDQGDIKAEFEAELQKARHVQDHARVQAEALSLELIQQLQKQDQAEQASQSSSCAGTPKPPTKRKSSSDQRTLDSFLAQGERRTRIASDVSEAGTSQFDNILPSWLGDEAITEDVLREQQEALAQLARLRDDEAMARVLNEQEKQRMSPSPRSLRSTVLTPNRRGAQSKIGAKKSATPSSKSRASATKKLKQLSLLESFHASADS